MLGWMFATVLAIATSEPVVAPAIAVDLLPPPPDQVMVIPDALLTEFRTYIADRGAGKTPRVPLIVEFLFRPDGLGMVYQHDATFTVAEAYRTRTANCLTFTLLTVALARAVGYEAYGQQIARSLDWRREGDTVYRSIHVNAGVRLGPRRVSVDVAWDQVITGDPPERISDARLLAHYYNNRMVELMQTGDLTTARRYADQSLALDPGYATSWSNLAVLEQRAGQPAMAERDSLHALKLDPKHVAALINLIAHYQRGGEPARAAPYLKRLDRLQARDPLRQYILALDFEKQGDWRQAAAHYQRAIRLYDGEYRFHEGLARAYAELGDTKRSERATQRARQLNLSAIGQQRK
jgi:tetratricopeptide (TPR) repeat protein